MAVDETTSVEELCSVDTEDVTLDEALCPVEDDGATLNDEELDADDAVLVD